MKHFAIVYAVSLVAVSAFHAWKYIRRLRRIADGSIRSSQISMKEIDVIAEMGGRLPECFYPAYSFSDPYRHQGPPKRHLGLRRFLARWLTVFPVVTFVGLAQWFYWLLALIVAGVANSVIKDIW